MSFFRKSFVFFILCFFSCEPSNVQYTAKYGNTIELGVGAGVKNKKLYTLTVHYPSGDANYRGETFTSFTIGDKDAIGEEDIIDGRVSFKLKDAPVDKSDWSDFITYDEARRNRDGSLNDSYLEGKKVNARFLYEDTTNKIKYYITPSAESIKDVSSEELAAFYEGLKQEIGNNSFSKSDVLSDIEGLVGLTSYRDSSYLYVVFDGTLINAGYFSNPRGISEYGVSGGALDFDLLNYKYSNKANLIYLNHSYYYKMYTDEKYGEDSMRHVVNVLLSNIAKCYVDILMNSNYLRNAEKKCEINETTHTIVDENGMYEQAKSDASKNTNYEPALFQSAMTYSVSNSSYFNIFKLGLPTYIQNKKVGYNDMDYYVGNFLKNMHIACPPFSTASMMNDNNESKDNQKKYSIESCSFFLDYIVDKYGCDIKKIAAHKQDYNDFLRAEKVDDISECIDKVIDDCMPGKNFKDIYLSYLRNMMQNGLKGIDKSRFKEILDAVIDENNFAINYDSSSLSIENLPELSFVINRWDYTPKKIKVEGKNIDTYMFWL